MLVREKRTSLKDIPQRTKHTHPNKSPEEKLHSRSALVTFLHSTPPADCSCRVDLARALIIIQLSRCPRAPLTPSRLPEIKHLILQRRGCRVRPCCASSPPYAAI